jgi:hypothetical protein
MDKYLIDTYLSTSRYHRYQAATAHDDVRAEQLYNSNIRISKAFYPILSQFEIVLRNSLNNILATHFASTDWIINEKARFMSHASLRPNFYLRKSVQNSENRFNNAFIPITSGKIISDQTFGFWVALFNKEHFMLTKGRTMHAFRFKPASEDRKTIHIRLEQLGKLRNRISHSEPICFSGNTIDCSHLVAMRTNLFELIGWIDPKLVPFFNELDSIQDEIDNVLRI